MASSVLLLCLVLCLWATHIQAAPVSHGLAHGRAHLRLLEREYRHRHHRREAQDGDGPASVSRDGVRRASDLLPEMLDNLTLDSTKRRSQVFVDDTTVLP